MYYLINVQHLSDGQTASSILNYETKEQVMSAYHNTLLYNYSAKDVVRFMVSVLDESMPISWESYTKEGDNNGDEE